MTAKPVIAVGTAMIAAQLVTFFMIVLSRLLWMLSCVSRIVAISSRRDCVHSVTRRT